MEFSKTTGRRACWHAVGVLTALFLGILLLTACSGDDDSSAVLTPSSEPALETPIRETPAGPQDRAQADDEYQNEFAEADNRNGERIYFTAANEAGKRITYRGGPDFGGMMMGSYLTCAACHGPEAQGGRHVMHMQVMDAPAISYRALNGEDGQQHEGEGDDHTGEAGEYDLEDFRLAVVKGQHPDGSPLDENMPRWNLGAEDLRDLFAFLKTLP